MIEETTEAPAQTSATARATREYSLRPITEADLLACADVFYEAQDDLLARHALPRLPRDPERMAALFRTLAASDPALAWLAEPGPDSRGGVAGFGIAVRREEFWFLSFLFVRPAAQATGLGRLLLEQCMDRGHSSPALLRASCIDSIQPISAALYAHHGMLPRTPLYMLLGDAATAGLPALPRGYTSLPFESIASASGGHAALVDAVDLVDQAVLGFTRGVDHRAWRVAERRGVMYRREETGEPVGYGYAQESGRLGPIALAEPTFLASVIGDLMTHARPRGAWRIIVPGEAGEALLPLLKAGFRIDGHPGIYCASRTGPRLDRYIPASFTLP